MQISAGTYGDSSQIGARLMQLSKLRYFDLEERKQVVHIVNVSERK